jgi:hypothetical protein
MAKQRQQNVRRWPLFFAEAYAALAAIQNPYRNATMHLD